MRPCLKLSSEQLEAARVKWLQQEEKAKEQAEAVRKMLEKKRGMIEFP